MSTGIKIEGSSNVKIIGGMIKGFSVGIDASGSSVVTEGVKFENVDQPYRVKGGSLSAQAGTATYDLKEESRELGKLYGGYNSKGAPRIPCQCEICDSIFPSRTFTIFNSVLRSQDNVETCPVCGSHTAKVASGLFEFTVDAVRLIAGSKLTAEQMSSLSELLADPDIESLDKADPAVELAHAILGLLKGKASRPVLLAIFLSVILPNYENIRTMGMDVYQIAGATWEWAYEALSSKQEVPDVSEQGPECDAPAEDVDLGHYPASHSTA